MAIDPKQVQAAFLVVVQAVAAERYAILDKLAEMASEVGPGMTTEQ